MNQYFEKNCYKPKQEKYIYFPLHYQPECTSLPMGGIYYDEELVIDQLSKCVDPGVKIYVKPHPHRSWFADRAFYDRISSYRNVCLISPKANSYELMDSAIAVVSLTGTAILEALVRGIPVLMFGYYISQYAPGVFHCKTLADVKHALDEICIHYNALMRKAYKIVPSKEINIRDIIDEEPSKSFRLVVAVRYLFIEYYFEGDNKKRALYNHAIYTDYRNGQDEVAFGELIRSIDEYGFDKNNAILMDKQNNVIDGTHRIAASIYMGKKKTYARIIPRNFKPISLFKRIEMFNLQEGEIEELFMAYKRMNDKIRQTLEC